MCRLGSRYLQRSWGNLMIDWVYVLMMIGFAYSGFVVVNASVGVLWKVAGVVAMALVCVVAPFVVNGGIFCAVGLVLGVAVGVVVLVWRSVAARVGRRREE